MDERAGEGGSLGNGGIDDLPGPEEAGGWWLLCLLGGGFLGGEGELQAQRVGVERQHAGFHHLHGNKTHRSTAWMCKTLDTGPEGLLWGDMHAWISEPGMGEGGGREGDEGELQAQGCGIECQPAGFNHLHGMEHIV